MIIDNTYFKGDLYINQAKPSIMAASDQDQEFTTILNKYEENCLEEVLGHQLYRELAGKIDKNESSLIKAGSDAKWDELLNGKEFEKEGKTRYWKGIRFKTPLTNEKYNRSFLANYVYYFYKRNNFTFSTETGEKKIVAANAVNSNNASKAVKAWNEFVEMVKGKDNVPNLIYRNVGLGVDYYAGDGGVSLYEFIKHFNEQSDYYPSFIEKTNLSKINEFGL